MNDRFLTFLNLARWTSAIVAISYHLRFLLLVNYDAAPDKHILRTGFYFLTGLGHESYAVFFILDGVYAGLILQQRRALATADGPGVRHYVGALYRLVLPGLLLGAALDFGGARQFGATGVYTDYPEFSTLALAPMVFLGNLLMLQPWLVPEFGSNSMLYLPAWLFWYFAVLLAFIQAAKLGRVGALAARVVLVAAVLALMPYTFLIWAAIWLAGVGLVFLLEARAWRPSLLLALPLFGATLIASRLLAPYTADIPQPMRDWLIQSGFLLVGLGFAAIVWALYPKRTPQDAQQPAQLAGAVAAHTLGWSAQSASFAFYFHFPVTMLFAAAGAAWWDQALKRQPDLATLAWFACLLVVCVVVAALVTRATKAVLDLFVGTAKPVPLTGQRREG